jgi:hypothetical protein
VTSMEAETLTRVQTDTKGDVEMVGILSPSVCTLTASVVRFLRTGFAPTVLRPTVETRRAATFARNWTPRQGT